MGGSNEAGWSELAAFDDEFAEVFDGYAPIPEFGENHLLDALIDLKHISRGALVRIGARLVDDNTIAYAFDGGIKYRNLLADERRSALGSVWHKLKIVRASSGATTGTVIVAEGETDGAWLSDHANNCDVAIMPAGANPKPHTAAYVAQLAGYDFVLLGLDNDDAGNEGASVFMEHLTVPSARYAPPEGKDWCEFNGALPAFPKPTERPAAESAEVLTDEERKLVRNERLRLEVRERFDREQAENAMRLPAPEDTMSVAELLVANPEPAPQRVAGLLGMDHNFVLTAQYKTGKTTTTVHADKALLDGGRMFGEFEVMRPLTGNIGLWNVEMEAHDMLDYVRAAGLEGKSRLQIGNFKGLRIPMLADVAAEWAVNWLREHEVELWQLDPWRNICGWSGVDENSNSAVTMLLDRIDQIKREAGVSHVWINHHTGQDAKDRSRGAAALDDWKDVGGLLILANDARYFSATGRGVAVPQGRLSLVAQGEAMDTPVELVYRGGSRAADEYELARVALISKVREQPGQIGHTQATAIIGEAIDSNNNNKRQSILDRMIADDDVISKPRGTSKLLWPVDAAAAVIR
jgi:hypothetical protein